MSQTELMVNVVIVRKAYQGGASAKGVRKVRCKASGDREATLRKPLSPVAYLLAADIVL
jgi:hypothetical protein